MTPVNIDVSVDIYIYICMYVSHDDTSRGIIFDLLSIKDRQRCFTSSFKGHLGSTPNSVPMVFTVLFRDSWGL